MKIAILGASGIGKNHARWFHKHGCQIVAFLGSSPQSLEVTQAVLQKQIGEVPPGFCDLDKLLNDTKPDAVCIANPPALHFAHAKKCLESGAHVLCEKPLVGDETKSREELIEQANVLIETARNSGCPPKEGRILLGTQMQYALAVPLICELAEVRAPIVNWRMEMETKNVRPGRAGKAIWIDLSPHPLSVLQKVGDAEIVWDTVTCVVGETETRAAFQVRFKDQSEPCDCEVIVRVNPDRVSPLRRVSLNERDVDLSARANSAGEFRAFFRAGETEIERDDLADALIGNFVAACRGEAELVVTGEDGAKNVAWQLGILERGFNHG